MCERYVSRRTWKEIQVLFQAAGTPPPEMNFEPRYNIAPTQSAPMIRLKGGKREIAALSWGLVPSSAKDKSGAAKMINAKAETVAEKREFRSGFLHRRCLVVADGFYEWAKVTPKETQPYFVSAKDSAPFAFAGFCEWWIPREGPRFETFAIITCAANAVVAPLHNRMPVMLPGDAWSMWLGEQLVSPDRLKSLLKPFPSERMQCWSVGRAVTNTANDEPGLIERVPIEPAAG
jgi:putative SOS response-associated peptidase YedK